MVQGSQSKAHSLRGCAAYRGGGEENFVPVQAREEALRIHSAHASLAVAVDGNVHHVRLQVAGAVAQVPRGAPVHVRARACRGNEGGAEEGRSRTRTKSNQAQSAAVLAGHQHFLGSGRRTVCRETHAVRVVSLVSKVQAVDRTTETGYRVGSALLQGTDEERCAFFTIGMEPRVPGARSKSLHVVS